jgi:hypothetical protein
VPKGEAAVETIGALDCRYGDRHLAVGRRRQPKKRTQGDGGLRQMLVAARGRLIRRAVPSPPKRHGHTECPECNSGLKYRCARRQLRLRKERTSGRLLRKIVELEFDKQIVGSSTGRTRGPPGTLSGNRSGRAALKWEGQEKLGSSRATGKEGKPDHRCPKHVPRKRRNSGTPVGEINSITTAVDK